LFSVGENVGLTTEEIAGLLAPKAAQGRVISDGLWASDEVSYNSFDGETYPCAGCGHCDQPGKCPQSVTCPKCGSAMATLCKEGTRLVGFHEERWKLSGGTYRSQTKEEKLIALVLESLK
jgi:hypothetical protein